MISCKTFQALRCVKPVWGEGLRSDRHGCGRRARSCGVSATRIKAFLCLRPAFLAVPGTMSTSSKAPSAHGDLFAVLLGCSQQAPAERACAVARLLQAPHVHRLQLEGPSGFTALHAAVLGGAGSAALPLLAAAGAPLNQPLSSDAWGVRGSEERAFLGRCGIQERSDSIFMALQRGYTPLAAAARQAAALCWAGLPGLGQHRLPGNLSDHFQLMALLNPMLVLQVRQP